MRRLRSPSASSSRASEDALLLYNLACYESLAGETDSALEHLRRSIALDPAHRALAADDPDFDSIRSAVASI